MQIDASDLANLAIKNAKHGEEIACLVTSINRKMVRFSNGEFTVSQAWDETETAILYKKEGKTAIGSTLSVSAEAVISLLEKLRASVGSIKPKQDFSKLAKEMPSAPTPTSPVYDSPDELLADIVIRADSAAMNSGAERSAVVLNSERYTWNLATTTGIDVSSSSTSNHLVIRAFCSQGSGQGITASSLISELSPEAAGKRAGELAKDARSPERADEGYYDVVLDPSMFANLIDHVGYAASAYAVESGFSFLTGKLGKTVASPNFFLFDDGMLKGGLLHRAFDDEGYKTQRTAIIEGGTLQSYLTNSHFSAKMGIPNTANAGWIEPRPWNLEVATGKEKESDLFDGHVIYITNNWYTRFQNYVTGDFSTILRDAVFEVRNGDKLRALKGLRLSDNLPRMLSSIQAIGNKQYLIRWWEVETPVLLPYVRISNVHLTSAD
ncbi:MAG: TldD/PmbA family protein [Thermoprotei archaeon]|jgi:PmbA protein